LAGFGTLFVSNCSVLLLNSYLEGRVRFTIGLSCNWIVLLVSCDASLLHFLLISDLVCWMGLFLSLLSVGVSGAFYFVLCGLPLVLFVAAGLLHFLLI
jgi:hypothetical protein